MTTQAMRSALYIPASNARAIAKASTLACDVVILDLEDAVAPEVKADARAAAVAAIGEGRFGSRKVVVRVNGLDTEHWEDDVAALRDTFVPVLVPKVGGPDCLASAAEAFPDRPLWAMIETCGAILHLPAIAACAGALPLAAFVVGANDLAKEMSCRLGASRRPIWGSLGLAVTAARAHGISVLDAVYNDIDDSTGFEAECREGADFGFDGKTLIHPRQIEACNRLFSPSMEEIDWARRIVAVFAEPQNAGVNALTLDGRMVERLHLEPALRVLARS